MFDWINGLLSDGMSTLRLLVTLAAAVVFLVIAISSRFAVGRTLITGVLAGFVIWAVAGNGLGWFSERVGDETASPSTTITQIESL
jgi:hypothetical protein